MNRKPLGILGAMVLLVIGVLGVTGAGAGPTSSSVTGSISLSSASGANQTLGTPTMKYGDSASFNTSVSGKMASRSYVYINVVCLQNGTVVYQASGPVNGSFSMSDQAGDGLNWNGGAADCDGSLVYRIDYQKGSSITYLDNVDFDVAA